MLRDSLRAHTRSHHERIERALDLPGSVRDQRDYVRLLSGLYGFYVVHEPRLELRLQSLAHLDLRLSLRRKARKLHEDLQSCGLSAVTIASLPTCRNLPRLRTWAHALGSMYVLEGSTLGGQVIAGALQRRLQLDPESQMQFLLAYGAHSGAMWRSFVTAINAIELAPDERVEPLEGAIDTFDAMERWLSSVYAKSNDVLGRRAPP